MQETKQRESTESVDWSDTETHLNVEVKSDESSDSSALSQSVEDRYAKNHIEKPEDGDVQVIWEFDMFVGEKPTITRKVRKFDGGYRCWRNVGRETYEPSEYKKTAPEQVQDVFDGIYVSK